MFPHQKTLAEEANVSKSTVKATIKLLKSLNFISVVKRQCGNLYRFTEAFFRALKGKVNSDSQKGNNPPSEVQSSSPLYHEHENVSKEPKAKKK